MNREAIQKRIDSALARMSEITAHAESENRSPNSEEREQITNALATVRDGRDALNLLGQIEGISGGYEPTPAVDQNGGKVIVNKGTAGERFINDPEIQAFLSRTKLSDGSPSNSAFGASPRVVLNDLIRLGGTDSGGEMTVPDQTGLIVAFPRRPLTIEDLITVGRTTSDVVEYVQVTAETNTAAAVAETTTTTDPVGVKPESAMTFDRKTATVRTIAHWVPATRQALSDVGQLRTIIDSFLRDGLLQTLETEIIAGAGTGEHFTGLMTAAGLTQAFDTDRFTTTRKARTKLMTDGRVRPNAWLINPLDMEDFDLTQDNEGRYYGAGPFDANGNERLWRVPVVEHEAVTEGYALLGDFKRAVLWRRSDAEIMVSDSHSDFFVRNLIAILAEMRAAFALVYPNAVIKADIIA